MSDETPSPMDAGPSAPAAQGNVFSRAIGIIVSPGPTFAKVLQTPSPWSILFLVAVVMGLVSIMPYITESGRQMLLDTQITAAERMTGQPLPDEAIEAMANQPPALSMTFGFLGQFVSLPIMALIFTAIFWALFNAILGGTASFKQVLTVVAHGMVIMALGAAVSLPIMMQGVMSMTGPFNLGALVPMLDETNFIARLLGALNVFTIWQTVVVAIGLGVLYKRSAGSIATWLLMAYVLLAALIISVFGALFGIG
jgi:hypothetical protein